MTASQFQECIRHLYCMGKREFIETWGEEKGCYLWLKFHDELKKNVGDFICYLDNGNMRLLFNHLEKYLMEVKAR